jgi:hypothetical protein
MAKEVVYTAYNFPDVNHEDLLVSDEGIISVITKPHYLYMTDNVDEYSTIETMHMDVYIPRDDSPVHKIEKRKGAGSSDESYTVILETTFMNEKIIIEVIDTINREWDKDYAYTGRSN